MDIKRIWFGFWQVADPKIWIASAVPMAVAAAFAYARTGSFSLIWFIVCLIAIFLIEIGKNALNEVVDYKSGVDTFVDSEHRTPFSGGKKSILDGKLTVKEASIISLLTLMAAAGIGLYVIIFYNFNIIWVGLIGILISILYSLPPVKLIYRGFGEIAVGITYGPLIFSGVYIMMTGTLDFQAVLVSLPIAFLITNVLWINQYPDYEADKQGDKQNWVVRLGKKKANSVYALLFILAYLSIIVITIVTFNRFFLMVLITFPIAVSAVKTARVNYDNIEKLISANGKTIMIYQITGVLMVAASLL